MIVDLFAGPGGWSEGLRSLGLSDVGVELDPDCCLTRRAAGHRTLRADVSVYPPEPFAPRTEGLIASPPCQAWSLAGKGGGRREIGRIHRAVEACRDGWRDEVRDGEWADARTPLVLEPLRWAWTIRPQWIACEQVPPAMPVWEHMADVLRSWGYSATAVKLLAADYGVPQTRLRAFLLASMDGPVRVPEPTHAERPGAGLFGTRLPWVTMADALDWRGEETPARTIAGNRAPRWLYPDTDGTHGRTVLRGNQKPPGLNGAYHKVPSNRPAQSLTGNTSLYRWVNERPATTVQGDPRIAPPGHKGDYLPGQRPFTDALRISLSEAAVLQGMRPDYPFHGTKTSQFRQVGDVVPPAMAAAVVGALRGRDGGLPHAVRSVLRGARG
jgi:DNA (cytosine-5)-methyltransferase 1